MENQNVVIVKHHFRPLKLSNPFYTTQCPDIEDRIVINLTSRNSDKEFAKMVSPFYVGPIKGPDGAQSDSLEIFWQAAKVFPIHDNNGNPNDEYFAYREKMYSAKPGEIPKPVMRHPYKEFGYNPDDMLYWPLYNPERGEYERLSYLEGRKKVYVPEYAKLVANSDAMKWMKSLVDKGKKIALLDFDGFNYYSDEAMKIRYRAYVLKCRKEKRPILRTEKDFTDIKDMKSAINFAETPVGHAFVVKAILQGDLSVVDGKVIDPLGMLA